MPKQRSKTQKSPPQPKLIQGRELEFVSDPNAPAIYTDSVRVLSSLFDFTILLNRLELGPKGEPRMKQVGTLYMSPQHARAFVAVLAMKLEEW